MLPSQSVGHGELGAQLIRILHVGHDIGAPVATQRQLPSEKIVIKNIVDESLRASVCECPGSNSPTRVVKSMTLDAYPHLNGVASPDNSKSVILATRGADLRFAGACTRTFKAGHPYR